MKKIFLNITAGRVTDTRTAYHIEGFTKNAFLNPGVRAADQIADEAATFVQHPSDFMN
ncbi:MAG: hypothetical protein HDR96_09810 [Bacteroides sp.]|nr:hypothetical protein [Bacteroides sp.]